MVKYTIESFIQKAIEIHGNKINKSIRTIQKKFRLIINLN